MVRKGPVVSANTAPGSSICNFVLTENLIMDASTQVLVWICRDCGLHFPITESQARGTIWCDRCLLVESLRKQVGELQEEVARLRSIHTHEEFIENLHMETSKVEEQSSGRGLHLLATAGNRQCSTPAPNPLSLVMQNQCAALAMRGDESPPKVEEEKPCNPKAGSISAIAPKRK